MEAAADLAEDHHWVEQTRIEMLRGYAEADTCRRELLLTYFGEPFEPPCGACDNCEAGLSAEDRAGYRTLSVATLLERKLLRAR